MGARRGCSGSGGAGEVVRGGCAGRLCRGIGGGALGRQSFAVVSGVALWPGRYRPPGALSALAAVAYVSTTQWAGKSLRPTSQPFAEVDGGSAAWVVPVVAAWPQASSPSFPSTKSLNAPKAVETLILSTVPLVTLVPAP